MPASRCRSKAALLETCHLKVLATRLRDTFARSTPQEHRDTDCWVVHAPHCRRAEAQQEGPGFEVDHLSSACIPWTPIHIHAFTFRVTFYILYNFLFTCYILHVTCYMLHVTCYMSHVTCDMLHVVCINFYVTCHMLPFFTYCILHATCMLHVTYMLHSICYFYTLHCVYYVVNVTFHIS